METRPTFDELEIFDDISHLGSSLWEKSTKISGLNTDPKMFSIMLFKRLWSNHRGFSQLWKNALYLEADIILRSGIEAAICIAANFRLRDSFVELMHRDATFTVQGQIKLHRDNSATDIIKFGEATLRDLQARLPTGVKATKLDWKSLAEQGGVPHLYGFHRMLSGVSSHVTGLSIITSVADDRMVEQQSELRNLTRKMHLMMMAAATLQGSLRHAGMIDSEADAQTALSLTDRMNVLSMRWPGVGG